MSLSDDFSTITGARNYYFHNNYYPFARELSTQATGGLVFPCGNPAQGDKRGNFALLRLARLLSLLPPINVGLSHGTGTALSEKTQPLDRELPCPLGMWVRPG